MVKTYQLSSEGPYGTSIKVAPVTTETNANKQTCLQVNGTGEMKIRPQTIIPDIAGMEVRYKNLFMKLITYEIIKSIIKE
jgi:hypothetical protein